MDPKISCKGNTSTCVAVGCSMRGGTNLLSKVKMFFFPRDPERRKLWVLAVRRKDWTPKSGSVLCNFHFITGAPNSDPEHPDYVPSRFAYNQLKDSEMKRMLTRYERKRKREGILAGKDEIEDVALRRSRKAGFKSVDRNRGSLAKDFILEAYADETYTLLYKNRGRCLIFNHTVYSCGVPDRPESGLDAKALKKFFGNRGFDVKIHNDKNVFQINAILEIESKRENFYNRAASCFVCCVLTHGILIEGKEHLCAKDATYPTEQLFEPFSADNCKELAGKPKIFFIEACRGDDYDGGANVFSSLSTLLDTSLYASNSLGQTSEQSVCCKVPIKTDFLIAYATTPNYIARKRSGEGSWFIQILCKVLEARAEDSDLLSMMTIVCRKVALEYESRETSSVVTNTMKQVPSIYSTLTKKMKFPPKIK